MNTFSNTRPHHNQPPAPTPPKAVPFSPPSGYETHEYRVLVNTASLSFTTAWYVEFYARAVHDSLRAVYPNARVTLQRRAMAGELENL